MDLAKEVKKEIPDAYPNIVWEIIYDNDMKENPDYSAYNFRNKRHEDEYKKTGQVPSGTPSIYNQNAVEFIVNVVKGPDYQ